MTRVEELSGLTWRAARGVGMLSNWPFEWEKGWLVREEGRSKLLWEVPPRELSNELGGMLGGMEEGVECSFGRALTWLMSEVFN